MNRAERIAAIIDQRKPLATRIQSAIAHLETLREALGRIEAKRRELLQKVNEDEIQGKLNELDFRTPHDAITEQVAVLEKLQKRFERPTLNIGVVGQVGQGKSTFLQSITGLGNEIIPARGGADACTAVMSVVHHRPGQATEAKITFHSPSSLFEEVILPYYQKLELRPVPRDWNDFIYGSFEYPEPSDAVNVALLKNLKKYYAQSGYRSLLGAEPKIVPASEIKGYVTHFNAETNPNNHQNLAVKGVEIYCEFINAEVGKIALVDIPGLGDHVLGDEKLMLNALGQEVDAVLFIRFPNPIGGSILGIEDTKLYDKASTALQDLSARAFMVFNKIEDNQESLNICQEFQSQLSELGIKVVESFISDCRNSDEVNSQVLDKVLNYLSTKIKDLDIKKAQFCQEKVLDIQNDVKTGLQKAGNILSQDKESDDDNDLFDEKCDEFLQDIGNTLINLREELAQNQSQEDIYLKNQFEQIFKNLRNQKNTILPTVEQIKARSNTVGNYGLASTYESYLNEVRTLLSGYFLDLDEGLIDSVENLKEQVADLLIRKTILKNLFESEDFVKNTKGSKLLKHIKEKQIPERLEELKKAFGIIADFRLSYRGMIQHRIRPKMNLLDPKKTTPLMKQEPSDADVFEHLEELYRETLFECEGVLQNLLIEPSQAAFAILEEFVDRGINAKNIKKDWRKFIRQRRADLWPEDFQILAENTRIHNEWNFLLESVSKYSQSPNLTFID